ncbi:MAG: uncharacterized protein JWN01_640 [Patescibacteria group bacterium]|nr:uncharacterized protein [Patescibacteria group bacterium]
MKDNALYLEVDEDITSAIDKLTKSTGDSVQIVVPKRSSMLQSVINLKLLKKAAGQQGKELVLVTNDRIASDLAARVGLAVAPSLGAKPVLADVQMPEQLKSVEEVIDAGDPAPPVAGPAPAAAPAKSKRPLLLRRREVGDGPPAPPPTPDPAPAAAGGDPAKKGPKIPNFNRLQRRVIWLVVAALLVGSYMAGMYFLSSAKVTLYANGSKVDIDTTFAVDPAAKTSDKNKAVLAGQVVSTSKDLSGSFAPTGKKDAGTKATGTISISNCLDNNPHTFVSGTRFQAPDGKIFRSTAEVVVPGGQGSFFGCTAPGMATATVQADQNGDSYNEGPSTYTMPGLPASQQTGQNSIISKGAQMSGGTTKTVSVVTQADIDTAKAALIAKDKDNAGRDLQSRVPKDYTGLTSSQSTITGDVVSSPAVETEATTANLSLKVTYTVLAVKKSEYQEMVKAQELKQVGAENQIYDDGLANAQVTANEKDSSGRQTFHLTTEASGGVKIDTAGLIEKLRGKRYGDAADLSSHTSGVTRADIVLWPSWASSLPGRSDKITVKIQVEGTK